MGADLSYECLGNNQYLITLNIYRDCSGIAVNTDYEVTVSSATCGSIQVLNLTQVGNGVEVSPLCPAQLNQSSCNGGTLPGTQQYTYQSTVTLPQQCNDWVIATTDIDMCCRNSAITNLVAPDSEDLHLRATLNNTNGICNNSPFFTTLPVPYICNGQLINYNHGTVDVDGDSLVYTLTNPLTSGGNNIGYTGGYTPTGPMNTAGVFQFAGATGQMSFTPSGQQVAVVAVLVQEYRNGVLIGSAMRDIQVVVLNCSNNFPASSSINNIANNGSGVVVNGAIEVCPGDNINFSFTATDPNANDIITVTDNAAIAIPGSNISYLNNSSNSITGTFTWVPSAADTGLRVFTVTVEDNACPTIGTNTFSYAIRVLRGTTAGPDRFYCSAAGAVLLTAAGGTQFTWTPAIGLSCTNCQSPLAAPPITTTYIVQSNLSSTCKNRDTVTVTVAPNFSLEAGTNATICLNAIHQINATASSNGAPYTVNWSPPSGLSNTSILNPIASPSVSTSYLLNVTSVQGCTLRDSLRVIISGVAPSVTAFASDDTLCPGASTVLNFSVLPRTCGLSTSPCINGNTPYTVGTGNLTTSSGTPYDGFWEDGRVQILFRASELSALGITAGTINTVAWNVISKNSLAPYNNFNIKMGCVSNTALSSFVPNLTTVLTLPSYNTILGWNQHTLTTGYNWDGVSNLLVEICFDNNDYTNADEVSYTNTTFNSVLYNNVDGAVGCNLSLPTVSAQRPNTRFGICAQSLNNATINWTVSSGNATILTPTSQQTNARILGTTTFVVNVSQGGCSGQGFVSVVADTTVSITAGPDTAFCSQTPVQLFANSVGTPGPIQLTCGVNNRACASGSATVYTIGSNAGVTSSTTPFIGQEQEGRTQILLRSSELNAAGFTAGIIRSLAFNISSKNSSAPFNQFTIRIGCTSATALNAAFTSGLTQVFNPKPISTTIGWNTFTFDNTYDWDGLSNLLIEICFTNTGNTNNDIITYTQTAYTSVVNDAQSFLFVGGCSLDEAPTASSFRPDIRLSSCASPSGVFSYSWTPSLGLSNASISNPIANVATSSTYIVSITDGTCVASDSVTIQYYNGYQSNINGNNVGCNGAIDGNLVSSPSGGIAPYNFAWSVGQNTPNAISDTVFNLSAGTYRLSLTDANGCSEVDTFTLTVPPPLALTISGTDVTCFGYNNGTVIVNPTGGTQPYNYLWNSFDTIPVLDSINGGTYTVIVTDASGCNDSTGIAINEPQGVNYTTDSTLVSCFNGNDGSASIAITGGGTPPYAVLWSNAFQENNIIASTNNNLSAGYITFQIFDNSGCFVVDSILINERDSFTITAFNLLDASCYNTADGQAIANVNGDTINYQFSWVTPPIVNNAFAGLRPQGNNEVQVTDALGCTQSAFVNIGSPPQIILSNSTTNVICYNNNDGSARVEVNSGGVAPFDYLWNNNSSSTDSIVVGLAAGSYIVTVTDANGCFEWDTVILNQPDSFLLSTLIFNASCYAGNDGNINIIVTGGTAPYQYTWLDSNNNIIGNNTSQLQNISAADYQVIISDSFNCVDTITGLTITEPTRLQLGFITVDETCPSSNDGVVTAIVSGGILPYLYTLNSASSSVPTTPTSNSIFTGLIPENYSLSVTDSNNCTVDSTFTINNAPSFQVNFNPDSIKISLGDETTIQPNIIDSTTGGYSYNWVPNVGLSCANCETPIASPFLTTIYELTVTDSLGCSITVPYTIVVENNLLLYVPNAFSPNGDGINDLLLVFGVSLKKINFNIFNRWGEKVFDLETSDLTNGWDGTYFGKLLPPEVYVYYLDATFDDGQTKQQKGSITIVR